MMKIEEKNFRRYAAFALVTGAASGMGRAYSLHLARMGYNLVLVDINGAGLKETASIVSGEVSALDDWRKEYASAFRTVTCVQDLSLPDAASSVAQMADAEGCNVEVLVNNAGMFFFREISEVPQKYLSRMMMLHMHTPLMLCREFVPKMKAGGCGYVLNISSLAAWMAWPGVGMYGNTKRFIKDFSRSLRIECRGTGVSVTTAYFGAVDTDLFGLTPFYRRIARRIGVMVSVEKAVESALKATFKRRKSTMPGLVNHIARPVLVILPDSFLHFLYEKLKFVWTKF